MLCPTAIKCGILIRLSVFSNQRSKYLLKIERGRSFDNKAKTNAIRRFNRFSSNLRNREIEF